MDALARSIYRAAEAGLKLPCSELKRSGVTLFPYWLLFGIFAAGAVEYRRRGAIGEQSAPLLVFAGLLTALMIGLRYQVGGDWYAYEGIYFHLSFLSLGEALRTGDPGYAALNWIANGLGFGMWFVNLVCGAIFSWGLVRFARRLPNPWLAILVAVPYLVIVVVMGYSRQGVAIGIILAGLSVLDRSSLLRFGLYIIAAATFHKSAVIILPLVALAAARNRFLIAGLLFGLALMLYYFFIQATLDVLVTNYIDSGYSSEGAAIRVAMNIAPALLFFVLKDRLGMQPQQIKLWRNFSLAALASLAFLFLLEGSTAVDRLALYLTPLQLVVFSSLPQVFANKDRPSGLALILVIAYSAAIQFVWLNYATHAEFWLPYRVYPLSEAT